MKRAGTARIISIISLLMVAAIYNNCARSTFDNSFQFMTTQQLKVQAQSSIPSKQQHADLCNARNIRCDLYRYSSTAIDGFVLDQPLGCVDAAEKTSFCFKGKVQTYNSSSFAAECADCSNQERDRRSNYDEYDCHNFKFLIDGNAPFRATSSSLSVAISNVISQCEDTQGAR